MAGAAPGGIGAVEARALALRYLARREYARAELVSKLTRRGADAAVAAEVVEDLASDGLVSDQRFTEMFCRQRVAKFQGPVKIRAELRARGVDDAVISDCLQPYEGRWSALALDWLGRRASGNMDRKEKARHYRGALNRGFTHEHIMGAIDRFQGNR